MRLLRFLLYFFGGGAGYSLIEILWRGYTHPSMTLTGGICLFLISCINRRWSRSSFILRGVLSAVAITAVELSVGAVVNLWLKLSVWDYSGLPLNLLGQVSLPFSAAWFLLSLPMIYLCGAVDRWLSDMEGDLNLSGA